MAPKNVELHPHPWPFWDILKKSDTPGYYTLVINPINIYIYMCVYVCMYVYKNIYTYISTETLIMVGELDFA